MRGINMPVILICLLTVLYKNGYGQGLLPPDKLDQTTVYTNLDQALRNPDRVFQLDLLTSDLKELPASIGRLKKLQRMFLYEN
jgi:hypothetical protein